ncbi:MAG: hypothetical protein H6925_01770 [Holosporaceae bacterium]|nr:MAG: hypothetical protein H6925_01770 [Holosporaceae bacterium]
MHQEKLDAMTREVVESGLAVWSGVGKKASLIVNGQSNLLDSVQHIEELNAIKDIFFFA